MNVHHPEPTALVIPINTAISNALDLTKTDGKTVIGLVTPAAWTAADIAFKVSVDGVTYVPLYDARTPGAATEVTIASASVPTSAARGFALDPSVFAGYNYLKIVSGTNALGVNQGAARTLYVLARRV
jgi:hypothetical protein